jgi:LysE type translocator
VNGVAVGQCAWAVATSAGLAALLVASEPAFHALRWLGAAYLVYLGVQSLAHALRAEAASNTVLLAKTASVSTGLVSNLGNPKMAVFFSSLLPQFAHSFRRIAGPRPSVRFDAARVVERVRGGCREVRARHPSPTPRRDRRRGAHPFGVRLGVER